MRGALHATVLRVGRRVAEMTDARRAMGEAAVVEAAVAKATAAEAAAAVAAAWPMAACPSDASTTTGTGLALTTVRMHTIRLQGMYEGMEVEDMVEVAKAPTSMEEGIGREPAPTDWAWRDIVSQR